MRQISKRVTFSESCSEVSLSLRHNVSAGKLKTLKIRLRASTFLINVGPLRLALC
jgi:hypothetical protein